MPYAPIRDRLILEALIRFGKVVRAARRRRAITQMHLELLSGVDQTMISRLERGLAVSMPVWKVLRLQEALGTELPLGICPHDHRCHWNAVPPPTSALSTTDLLRRLIEQQGNHADYTEPGRPVMHVSDSAE